MNRNFASKWPMKLGALCLVLAVSDGFALGQIFGGRAGIGGRASASTSARSGRMMPPIPIAPPLPPFVRMTPMGPMPQRPQFLDRSRASGTVSSGIIVSPGVSSAATGGTSSTTRYYQQAPPVSQSGQPSYTVPPQTYGQPAQPAPTVAPAVPTPVPPLPATGVAGTNSKPAVVSQSSGNVAGLEKEALRYFELQRYGDAMNALEQLVAADQGSSEYLQLRSLTHYALGNYDEAAADAYDGLTLGSDWDWNKIYSIYGNAKTYENQLRLLEASSKAENVLSQHFLLGYHYLILGHHARAKKEMEAVLKIQPDEALASYIVQAIAQQNAETVGF